MDEYVIKVYVRIDENKVIKEINSSIFIDDYTGFIEIDEGNGDKYSHAQSQYLEKGIADLTGKFNYKLVDGKVVELTDKEKETLFPTPKPEPTEVEILRSQLLATQAMLVSLQEKMLGTTL